MSLNTDIPNLNIKCTPDNVGWWIHWVGFRDQLKENESFSMIYVHDSKQYQLNFMCKGEHVFADTYYEFEDLLEKFNVMQPGKPLEISKKKSDFATALEDIKAGKSVTRSAWMLKGWQLSLLFKNGVTYNQVKTHLGIYADDEKIGDYPFKFIITDKRKFMVNTDYQLTTEDILAQDWHAIN